MNQLIARQLINNSWFIVGCCLMVSFVFFLREEMRHDGWYGQVRNKAAIALLIYCSGETMARGWSVFLLKFYSRGTDAFVVEQRYPIALVGAGIALTGAACMLRIFSPPEWGHKGWIISMLIASIFTICTTWLW